MKTIPLFVSTLLGFLWLVAMATPAAASDLVPILSSPPNGTFSVRNAGTAAGPTLLLVNCRPSGGGKCAYVPPDQLTAYTDPNFPDQLVIKVPALRPGERFDHRLPFWDQMCWPAGSYVISARADGGNSETESNEGNNYVESTLASQRADCPPNPDYGPDLVPISNDLTTRGTAIVWNNGTVASGPTLLLVSCRASEGGPCPPIPPDQMAAYSDPAFPNQIVVKVSALQPRTNFNHHLTFWDQLCWPSGSYVISARADVANSVAESNENNNYAEGTLVNTRPGCPAVLPDLRPILTTPPNGTVVVENMGRGSSSPATLSVSCRKEGGGSCPTALVNVVKINIPWLRPGERFTHRLPFWDSLCWHVGRYQIHAGIYDAGLESNKNNNEATSTLVIVGQRKGCLPFPADLTPRLTFPPDGTVVVENVGAGSSGPSLMNVSCRKDGGGSCPGALGGVNGVSVSVPGLPPGERFTHRLPFWDELCWPAGSYQFTLRADVGNSVPEGNEGNNGTTSTLVSRQICSILPVPPPSFPKPGGATPVPAKPAKPIVPIVPQPVKGK